MLEPRLTVSLALHQKPPSAVCHSEDDAVIGQKPIKDSKSDAVEMLAKSCAGLAGDVFTLTTQINRSPRLAIVSPAPCALLIVLIWIMASAKAGRERRLAEGGAMLHAQALSRSYTEQLQRTVSEVKQITLTLKYYW